MRKRYDPSYFDSHDTHQPCKLWRIRTLRQKLHSLERHNDLFTAHSHPFVFTSSTLSFHQNLTELGVNEGAIAWIPPRLSDRKTTDFISRNESYRRYCAALVLAVSCDLRFLFVEDSKVPCIWTHKRDYISHFNPQEVRTRIDVISLPELWRIHVLGQKYRSLVERCNALFVAYSRLNTEDDHSKRALKPKIDAVEMVADSTKWLSMKYESRKQDTFDLRFHDDEEITHRRQKPSVEHLPTKLPRGVSSPSLLSRDGRSPPASSSFRRKQVVESSEDVLDDDMDLPQVQDIQRIWDDERAGRGQEDEEDMDDFIDY
ncbi:hypothetical protein BKA83DRAFT_4495319 [Pisolithus microcarpus]|nr:hypothetical protein BKA83DRAFT_4495319 [Pisolithus microcarpus]